MYRGQLERFRVLANTHLVDRSSSQNSTFTTLSLVRRQRDSRAHCYGPEENLKRLDDDVDILRLPEEDAACP